MQAKECMMARHRYEISAILWMLTATSLSWGDVIPAQDYSDAGEEPAQIDNDSPHRDGDAADDAWDAAESGPRSELIRERHPNRSVKIERQVIQDASDNFVNHGKWKMWDPSGTLISEGQYNNGQRDGTWHRTLRGHETKLFSTMPFKQFPGPYVSQAEFHNGELNGTWTIYDGKHRKISQWEFSDGKRHGKWMWWFANGRKMREIDYREGQIDGEIVEWSPDGTLVSRDTYEDGRKLARKNEHYSGSHKKSEGMFLHARIVPEGKDDWWECKLSPFATQGKDEKHGVWTSWYQNGQMQISGEYRNDVQTGTFTWWHANGQKAAEGAYEQGQQTDTWTWWHDNGQKSIQGEFVAGGPTGRWTWWGEDGKVAQRADFSHSKGRVVEVPLPREPAKQEQRQTSRFRYQPKSQR
jgi:antitoxin component YwqK of YwqJK toxin-antitoxin module